MKILTTQRKIHRLPHLRTCLCAPCSQTALCCARAGCEQAAFDRIVDMVTIMETKPDLRAWMRAWSEAMVDNNTRVIVSHSLGTLFSYMALAITRTGGCTRS